MRRGQDTDTRYEEVEPGWVVGDDTDDHDDDDLSAGQRLAFVAFLVLDVGVIYAVAWAVHRWLP